jgi:hypothetical protein
MPRPKRKVYREGSPGYRRAAEVITLNAIRSTIKRSSARSQTRRDYINRGLLGSNNASSTLPLSRNASGRP